MDRPNAPRRCLCVEEERVDARTVAEQGCVCGCFTKTVSRYPALFEGVRFRKEDLDAIAKAGRRRRRGRERG